MPAVEADSVAAAFEYALAETRGVLGPFQRGCPVEKLVRTRANDFGKDRTLKRFELGNLKHPGTLPEQAGMPQNTGTTLAWLLSDPRQQDLTAWS